MNYEFKITPDFARDFKRLAKNHKHLAADFDRFLQSFVHKLGDIIPGTGGAQKFACLPRVLASVAVIESSTISFMRTKSIF